ncbi:TPR-like protein [Pyrenochaeta sp. DS3sAY3a]|nr:TPR-like protein [Pyrenochaeta sp. DS3sAY3a]
MDYTDIEYIGPAHPPHFVFGPGYTVNDAVIPDHQDAPHLSIFSTALTSYIGNDADPISLDQSSRASADVPSSMGPPSRPRKPKAPTLRDDDWEPYRERIRHLHVTQGLSVSEVRDKIKEEFGFHPELRQYRSRITKWGMDKNIKPHEMAAIVRKHLKRKLVEPHQGQLAFNVRGVPVKPQKIDRWMKKNRVVESAPYAPSPAALTPSDVGCYTISERGSPATMSAYSPAAMASSPGGVSTVAQSPRMASPALSTVSSIIRPQESTFMGLSPALAYRSLVQPPFNALPTSTSSAFGSHIQIHVALQPRYKEDEEEQLREGILQAELSSSFNTPAQTSDKLLDLGHVLLEQGRYKSAEDIARRLLERYKGQNDSDHDNNVEKLDALYFLGLVLYYQGLYTKAERLLSRTVHGRRQMVGSNDHDTMLSIHTLALVLTGLGKYEEAEELNREMATQWEKVLGSDHPATLASVHNLAYTLAQQAKYKEAELLNRETLGYRQQVIGPTHSDTLKTISNLAEVLFKQGKFTEAELMERNNLLQREKVLGRSHPDTLRSVSRLAQNLAEQEQVGEASMLFERAISGYTVILGKDHPTTVICCKNYADFIAEKERRM